MRLWGPKDHALEGFWAILSLGVSVQRSWLFWQLCGFRDVIWRVWLDRARAGSSEIYDVWLGTRDLGSP